MPEYVELIRSYTYAPDVMVEGIDESFDAAFYVGYHSAAGCEGNNLAIPFRIQRYIPSK